MVDKRLEKRTSGRLPWTPTAPDKYFQRQLIRFMKERNMTQDDLARELARVKGLKSMTYQTGHDIVNLKQQPTLSRVWELAVGVFKVPMTAFVMGSGWTENKDETFYLKWQELTEEQKNTMMFIVDAMLKSNHDSVNAEVKMIGKKKDENIEIIDVDTDDEVDELQPLLQ